MVTCPDCSTSSNILRRRPSARSRGLFECGMNASESMRRTAVGQFRRENDLLLLSRRLTFSFFFACELFLLCDTSQRVARHFATTELLMKLRSCLASLTVFALAACSS